MGQRGVLGVRVRILELKSTTGKYSSPLIKFYLDSLVYFIIVRDVLYTVHHDVYDILKLRDLVSC